MQSVFTKITLMSITMLVLSACSTIYDKHVQWQLEKPTVFPVLYASGLAPISLQKSDNKTQRMLMAIQASKLAAYAELAEQVYGQQLSNKVSMADLLINNQQLTASVQGVIRGAKVVKSYPVGDIYTTELALDFEDVFSMYETNFRKKIKDVSYF